MKLNILQLQIRTQKDLLVNNLKPCPFFFSCIKQSLIIIEVLKIYIRRVPAIAKN